MSQAAAPGIRRRTAATTATPAAALVTLLIAIVVLPVAYAATTVFRSVDAEGRVIFSDTPPATGESAETVEIKNPDSFEAPPAAPADATDESWDWDMREEPAAEAEVFEYAAVTVLSPANDEGVRDNSGAVTVVMGVEPELRPGHRIEILMDGQVAAAAGGSQVTLTEVERGTHMLLVRVIDDSGAVLIESAPSSFHMLRYVPLTAPNRPKPTPKGK